MAVPQAGGQQPGISPHRGCAAGGERRRQPSEPPEMPSPEGGAMGRAGGSAARGGPWGGEGLSCSVVPGPQTWRGGGQQPSPGAAALLPTVNRAQAAGKCQGGEWEMWGGWELSQTPPHWHTLGLDSRGALGLVTPMVGCSGGPQGLCTPPTQQSGVGQRGDPNPPRLLAPPTARPRMDVGEGECEGGSPGCLLATGLLATPPPWPVAWQRSAGGTSGLPYLTRWEGAPGDPHTPPPPRAPRPAPHIAPWLSHPPPPRAPPARSSGGWDGWWPPQPGEGSLRRGLLGSPHTPGPGDAPGTPWGRPARLRTLLRARGRGETKGGDVSHRRTDLAGGWGLTRCGARVPLNTPLRRGPTQRELKLPELRWAQPGPPGSFVLAGDAQTPAPLCLQPRSPGGARAPASPCSHPTSAAPQKHRAGRA